MATTTYAPPTSPDPFTALGGGVWTGRGWVPSDHPEAATAPAAPTTGSPTGGATGGTAPSSLPPPPTAPAPPTGTPGTGTAPQPSTPPAVDPIQQAYQTTLQQLMSGPSPAEAGMNAASSPAAAAYQLQQQRAEERQRALIAERNAAQGLSDSGAMETDILGLAQARGENEAAYVGQLAFQEQQARRQELMQAMTLAQQMGDQQAARDLQLMLANMDAGLRQQALTLQRQLGLSDLQLRQMLGLSQLDLQLLLGLGQLGYNYTALGVQGNQAGYYGATGGG